MPKVGVKKSDVESALRLGVGTALVGVGSAPTGLIGAGGSVLMGAISKKWIVKGTWGDILLAFSIINAVDLLMEGVTQRGVYG